MAVAVAVAARAPTQPPLLSQKQSYLSTERQRIIQGQAGGWAAKQSALANLQTPGPQPPCIRIALPFPSGGIIPNRQGGPFGSSANFQAVSSWAGSTVQGGPVYAVWSGALPYPSGAPHASAVTVYTETLNGDGCGVTYSFVGTFTLGGVEPPVTIVAATGRWLTLSSPSGALWYFDVVGDRFASTAASGG